MKRVVSIIAAGVLGLLLASPVAAAKSTAGSLPVVSLSFTTSGGPGAYVLNFAATLVSGTPAQVKGSAVSGTCSNPNLVFSESFTGVIVWSNRVGHASFPISTPCSFTAQAYLNGSVGPSDPTISDPISGNVP